MRVFKVRAGDASSEAVVRSRYTKLWEQTPRHHEDSIAGARAGPEGNRRCWSEVEEPPQGTMLMSVSGSGELIFISQHCLTEATGWGPSLSRNAMMLELQRNWRWGQMRSQKVWSQVQVLFPRGIHKVWMSE